MEGMKKAARVSQIIMGLILLLSGLVKVWEPILFYWEAIPYTQLLGLKDYWQVVAQVALLLGPFECGLGLALLANWRPRLIFPIAVVLMVFFLGLVTAAWKAGATDDCGCFGALVERSPGEAAVEDSIMLVLLLFAWWGVRRRASWRRAGRLVAGGTVLMLAVGCLRFIPEMDRIEGSDLRPGVRLTGVNPEGLEVDLMKGEYLLELMSPRCGRCAQSVPKMNELVDSGDLPTVIALTSFAQDSDALAEFKERLQPRFVIGTISKTDFFRLTWKHGYPRMAYVRDGAVQKVWEFNEIPDAEKLLRELGAI